MTARAAPPEVFSPRRRQASRRRARALQRLPGAARYILDDMVDDVIDRLGFIRHEAKRALVIGDWHGAMADYLRAQGAAVIAVEPSDGFAEDQPYPEAGFDLIVSLGTLDSVNDLPGALIHIRQALAPGGFAVASLVGAGSLAGLRAAMLEADGSRPAPRMHPMIDVRSGAQLLQRAGWHDPVADSRHIDVRFSNLASLIADLRSQGLTNVLARPGPHLTRTGRNRAAAAFDERRVERFELVTLSGWRR